MSGFVIFLSVVVTALLSIWHFFLNPPSNFPKNIPTIPFYVSLIPFFKDVDQKETFQRYLEKPLAKYGAVNYFFGARWNILVVRPEFVAEIFKHEDLFQKSGNQKKIPYSVLSDYTGDNIISSHGENWKLYHNILKPGLQQNFPIAPIVANAKKAIIMIDSEQRREQTAGVLLPPLLQRYTLANLSQLLLSTDFQTLERLDAPLHTMQLSVKREIFKPIFLSFPFLDLLPIPSRQRARRLVREFGDQLVHTVRHVKAPKSTAGCSESQIRRLDQPTSLPGTKSLEPLGLADPSVNTPGERLLAAHDAGVITELQLRHNLVSVFLAGHENPQLLLVSAMYLLGKFPEVQSQLRNEVKETGLEAPTHAVLESMPYLSAVAYETLRMLPPISQLINRRTNESTVLQASNGSAPIFIPEGTYIGYNSYATQHLAHSTGVDSFASVWGDDPDSFRPSRWGNSIDEIRRKYRDASRKAEFIAFHGGRRSCLGERFGILEGKVTLWELVRSGQWTLAESWADRMTPAGPLYPRMLRIKWTNLQKI